MDRGIYDSLSMLVLLLVLAFIYPCLGIYIKIKWNHHFLMF